MSLWAELNVNAGRWRVRLALLPKARKFGMREPAVVGWSGGLYMGPLRLAVDRVTADGRHEWRARGYEARPSAFSVPSKKEAN